MRRVVLVLACVAAAGCGQWQRVGADQRTEPAVGVAQVFDAASVYREMGLLVAGAPFPFVASARYLAGSADTTVALVALSLSNEALRFRRAGNEFVAEYRAEIAFRPDSGSPRQVAGDETVRVPTFQETLRADESVIYQQYLSLRPGSYLLSVVVRDRHSPNFARQEQRVTVPSYAAGGLATPIPYYEGSGRAARTALPRLVVNPRATLPFGVGDSLRVYVEAYGARPGAALSARVLDETGTALWNDTIALVGDSLLASASVALGPDALPLGRAELELGLIGSDQVVRAPILLSFSGQWVIANYDAMVDVLRYFEHPDLVRQLRDAPPEQRAAAWRDFWKQTDPIPITPDNEALVEYFRRVQAANARYREGSLAGWLTDRGEVLITLGDPDEVVDMSSDLNREGGGIIRWGYINLRLTLFFEDQTGFGQFRLTPASRSDYQQVLSRVRRAQ
ncbi:MAG: GWxTD domain-containing protein [Acidimicrobiales bacterium]